MKRSLSILLPILLLFSLLPVSALAEGEEPKQMQGGEQESAIPNYNDTIKLVVVLDNAEQSDTYTQYINSQLLISSLYVPQSGNELIEAKDFFTSGDYYCLVDSNTQTIDPNSSAEFVYVNNDVKGVAFKNPPTALNNNICRDLMICHDSIWYGLHVVFSTNSDHPAGGEEGGNDRPPTGMLRLEYGDDSYTAGDTIRLPAGWNNEVTLTVFGNDWEAIQSDLTCDRTVVKSLTPVSVEKGVWRVTISDTAAVDATGWIQYSSDVNNRINVTIITPTHGGAVNDADRINPADPPLVTSFEWNGKTYYLSLAGWEDDPTKLVPVGGRGRTVSDGSGPWLLSARVFDRIPGTPNQNGAVYQNNDVVYQAIKTAGWKFIIELHPADVGCEYYPVQEHNGDWYKYYINEYSVGRWIFEAKIVKLGEDGNITETLATNCCRHFYQYSKTINVDLDGDNVDSFNAQISAAVNDTATKYHLGEEVNALKLRVYRLHFRLPAGNFEGQLVLPFFSDHISLTGAVNKNESGEDVLLTTIRGGVRVDTHTCNIENIRFIGATDESGQRVDNESNCAIYGGGQGVYKNCVFEDFYYALHGKDRIAWGGMGSTFQNNHIAIYIEKALQGGNLDMVDNWFIGNDIAIQVDAFGPDLPVSLLTMRYDRFINNGVDMVNNSGVILWMSRNYFYRGERVNGTWPAYKGSNSNYIAYMPYLPVMGGKTPTFAYPLARNTECTDYFYPVWYAPAFWEQHQHPSWWAHYCPQWWGMDHYPSFVREGDRMPEGELTDTHVGFFDGERVVGSFDFGSSQEGE